MTARPSAPPGRPDPTVSAAQHAQITAMLGELPDDLLHAVRDARGHTFQRLEFLGDAVLELVVRMHAVVVGGTCLTCGGDADSLVTDAALAREASAAHLGAWLEWEPSHARMADLVEACAGAVWLAHGWGALAGFADRVVHPLAPMTPAAVEHGWSGAVPPEAHRTREVLGASVLEVAAAHAAFAKSDDAEGLLTAERNRLYATRRVVARALAAGWLDGTPNEHDHRAMAAARDVVERRLADLALASGLSTAVDAAADLLG